MNWTTEHSLVALNSTMALGLPPEPVVPYIAMRTGCKYGFGYMDARRSKCVRMAYNKQQELGTLAKALSVIYMPITTTGATTQFIPTSKPFSTTQKTRKTKTTTTKHPQSMGTHGGGHRSFGQWAVNQDDQDGMDWSLEEDATKKPKQKAQAPKKQSG